MAAVGFQRTIPSDGGVRWQLPTASYYSNRYANIQQAKDAAWQASLGVATAHAVIAAGGAIAWEGLERLK
jgi:hypothetical protein